MDVEASAREVPLDDRGEHRKQLLHDRAVARDFHVACDRVEVPQRRIGRVIERFALAFRKQVRQQAVAHVVRKRTQDRAGLAVATGGERQAFEADHRVATPVAEPVIAGVDAAQLAAFRLCHDVFFDSAAGQDHELIRGHCELLGERVAVELRRESEQTVEPAALRIEHGRCIEIHPVPGVHGGHEHDRLLDRDLRREVTRAERAVERGVAAVALDAVHELVLVALVGHERRGPGLQLHAQHQRTAGMADFVTAAPHLDDERFAGRARRRLVVPAKCHERSDLQVQACAAQQAVLHADRVLVVHHHDGFFEHDVVDLERPHRDAVIQTKLLEIAVRVADEAVILELGAAEVQLARRRDHGFVATRDHDVPALRCRQVRHEQAVILACGDARDRAGGVAAEAVRDQPFATAQLQRIAAAVPTQDDLPAVDHARPSTSSIALCAGSRHSPSPASATSIVTPWPP